MYNIRKMTTTKLFITVVSVILILIINKKIEKKSKYRIKCWRMLGNNGQKFVEKFGFLNNKTLSGAEIKVKYYKRFIVAHGVVVRAIHNVDRGI